MNGIPLPHARLHICHADIRPLTRLSNPHMGRTWLTRRVKRMTKANRFMEWWRQVNVELAALYQDDMLYGMARGCYDDRFNGAKPRTVAGWYARDVEAV